MSKPDELTEQIDLIVNKSVENITKKIVNLIARREKHLTKQVQLLNKVSTKNLVKGVTSKQNPKKEHYHHRESSYSESSSRE